jgi:hypothetical protein
MRFNEFNITEEVKLPTNYTTAPNMRPPAGPPKPMPNWVEKSAVPSNLNPKQDPGQISNQEEPAYKRAGKNEPVTKSVSSNARLPVEKTPTSTPSLKNDPVGSVRPGEPTFSKVYNNPGEYYDNTKNDILNKAKTSTSNPALSTRERFTQLDRGQPTPNIKSVAPSTPSVARTVATDVGNSALKSAGKKFLTKFLPGVGSTMDALDAYNRYQDNDTVGAAVSGAGAVGGLLPVVGAPISWGAAGINAYRDAMKNKANNTGTTNTTSTTPKVTPRPTPSSTTPVSPNVKQIPNNSSTTQPVTSTAPKMSQAQLAAAQRAQGSGSSIQTQQPQQAPKSAPQSQQAPTSSTPTSYKGSTGAQAIQRANANSIQDVNNIKVGQKINLPNGQGQYIVRPGDTLDKIASNSIATPSSTQSASNTANTNNSSPEDDDINSWRNQDLEKAQQSAQSTSTDEKPKFTPKDSSQIQADESTSINRIKSLAGLK